MELHPQIVGKDGKKEFVILPNEEFLGVQEELADFEDLRLLREAKEQENDAPTLSLSDVKRELGID